MAKERNLPFCRYFGLRHKSHQDTSLQNMKKTGARCNIAKIQRNIDGISLQPLI
jgi:hypothetical protein